MVSRDDIPAGGDAPTPNTTATKRRHAGESRSTRWLAYAFAVIVTAATLGVRLLLAAWFGDRPVLMVFFIPIILSAYVGGLGPGLVSTVGAAAGIAYYLVPPVHSFRIERSVDTVQWGILIVAGVLVSVLNEALHRYRLRDATTIAQLREAQDAKNASVEQRYATDEMRAQLASIVNSSVDAIIGKNLEGIITSWNPGAEKIFGYAAAEMMGTSIMRLIPVDRQAEEAHILGKIRQGERVENFETRRQKKDGSLIDVSVTASPIKDVTGRIIGVSKIARDVTARNQAEEQVRFNESVLRETGHIAKVGGWHFDARTGAGFWTEEVARIHDLPPDTPISMAAGINYYHGESRTRIAEAVKAAIEQATPYDLELEIETATGRRKWIRTIGHPVVEQGKVVLVRGSFQDITERKAAGEEILRLNIELEQRVVERTAQLEAANHELEAFSYSVSHDLRAPLRVVDGFSQAVLEDFGPQLPEEGRHQLETIRRNARRMGALIDDLLSFSKFSRQELKKRAVDMDRLVRVALEELGSPWPDRRVEIRLGPLPPADGDPALLKQLWANLLSNALKYTGKRERAVVEIGCTRTAGTDTFFVRDNGTGFDLRYADKLFGVFQRLHRIEDYEGTGVGLAIVQRIVHRHGGRVWADAAVDRGATFYFTLKPEAKP